MELSGKLKRRAAELGFEARGVCPAVTPDGIHGLRQWLEAGYAGQMRYLEERREAYEHPRHVLDGVRSILMLAMNYHTRRPEPAPPGSGRISRYAWGEADYHDVIHQRLRELRRYHEQLLPGVPVRGVVDTAPLLERDFARLAGLGWIGKNTLLLNRGLGSYFFLAALLSGADLPADEPFAADHCGTCRACLDACPTDAFPQPYVLDATRCISYLTIELREAIPRDLRTGVGDWLFGCDVCQDVCPWNRRAPISLEPAFQPRGPVNPLELSRLFDMEDAAFRQEFRRTPLWRSRRRGLLRNAAIVLGNQRDPAALESLRKGLRDDDPQVRSACAWALGQLPAEAGRVALLERRACEPDGDVLEEIEAALHSSGGIDRQPPPADPPVDSGDT